MPGGAHNFVGKGHIALHPKNEVVTVHGQVVPPLFRKVAIEMIFKGHSKDPLPVPVGDEIRLVENAIGTYVMWPESQIHVGRVPVLTYPSF